MEIWYRPQKGCAAKSKSLLALNTPSASVKKGERGRQGPGPSGVAQLPVERRHRLPDLLAQRARARGAQQHLGEDEQQQAQQEVHGQQRARLVFRVD
jgi:hypothetical protein